MGWDQPKDRIMTKGHGNKTLCEATSQQTGNLKSYIGMDALKKFKCSQTVIFDKNLQDSMRNTKNCQGLKSTLDATKSYMFNRKKDKMMCQDAADYVMK